VPTGFDYRQVLWDLEERGKGSAFRLTQNGDFLHLESDGSSDHTALGRIVLSKGWVQWWHEAPDGRANAPSLRGADCAEAIPVPEKGLLHLQAENEKLTIDGLQRPEWASGIMRTQYGLRVTPKKAENAPLYWADPGLIELRGVGGAVIGRFERTHGCFMGESLFLTLREEGFRYPDWADAFGKDEYGIWAEFEYQGVRQRMRWIWPGEFLMGSPETEVGRNKDEVQHEVMLTRGYWLADTTCTQALWKAVTGKNPSSFKGDERPVDYVIWEDGRAFCERLNRERPELALRLPTEAEWEYACRAGETKPFSFGETITTDQANFDGSHPYGNGPKGESGKNTVDVKALPPNTWGLYQMHGNVWEWCQDGYGEYPKEPAIDPVGPATRSGRVLRGGCWIGSAGTLRSAVRLHGGPGGRVGDTGFRLARGRTGSGGEDR